MSLQKKKDNINRTGNWNPRDLIALYPSIIVHLLTLPATAERSVAAAASIYGLLDRRDFFSSARFSPKVLNWLVWNLAAMRELVPEAIT